MTSGYILTAGLTDVAGNGAYLATGPSSPITINTRTASITGLVVKGVASQTANLQEWQNSAGTALVSISSAGFMTTSNGNLSSSTTELVMAQTGDTYGTTRLRLRNRDGVNGALFEQAGSVDLVDFGFKTLSHTGLIRYESRTIYTVSGGVEFQLGAGGNGYPFVITGTSTSTTNRVIVNAVAAAVVPFTVKGAASQTADLQQWQDSTGAVLAKVTSAGQLQAVLIDGGSA